MQNIMKKWKGLFFSVCMLVSLFSVTAYASDLDDIIGGGSDSDYEIILDASEYTYTAAEVKPQVVVAKVNAMGMVQEDTVLNSETDYTVTYLNNVNVGIATIQVDGLGVYADTLELEKNFTIVQASVEDADFTFAYKGYYYTGKERTPAVKVSLNGKVIDTDNYDAIYSNNIEIGTATVTVTGKNNLKGTANTTFEIRLKAPTFSLSRSYNFMRVWWDEVKGADGYQIYRSISKESGFKRVATIESGEDAPYKDTGLTHNKTYYYKVRAYKNVDGEKIYSAYSTIKSKTTRVATPTIQTISKTNYTTLTIKWNKIAGATGYKVYRSTSENGEYERIATLGGNDTLSYKNTGLTCGKVYYYKIRAYRTVDGTKYHGSYSNAKKSFSRPTKVKITDETNYNGTSITLYWKKSNGAEGYQVYRSTSKEGTYTLVKIIKSGSTLKWKDTDLSKNKNYYYKVRAFCETNGNKAYGLYSDVFRRRKAGWAYNTSDGNKVKLYYNAKGKVVKDVSNLIGKQDSYVIKVNKQRCTVTVYAKDGDNGYIIPVKAFVCSPGQSTPIGTFRTPVKYRWHELMGPCWGQWCTRIVGGVLFHSVFYNSYNNSDSLSVNAYNKLGTICSHGCVRLTAGDAKWIYDNCELNTKVIIYNSSISGPFGKPSAVKLPSWHTWDPTDPNKFDKCDARGCH